MSGLFQIILGVVLGAVGGVWAGPARGLLAGVSARVFGPFADAAPLGLVEAGLIFVVTGVLTMICSAIAKLLAGGAEKKSAARQLDLFHELLTGAIVRMVGADGKIAPAELSMVSGVLDKFGQTPVPEKTIRSISESFVKDPDRYLKRMAEEGAKLTDEQKTHILRACLLVAMADVTVDDAEVEYLKAVAEALKIPPERLDKIRDELTNVTQKLVSAAAFAA